jgi:nicotinamide N-methyltransferase
VYADGFAELKDTEDAHKKALADLDGMKEQMRTMEAERAAMIEEVEAQIENALQAMAIGIDASGDDDLAFGGAMSDEETTRTMRSRKASVASLRAASRHMRSLGTDSTLAAEELPPLPKSPTSPTHNKEEQEATNTHRFSALGDGSDAMVAVDEGISKQSDQIAAKVARIQQKVEFIVVPLREPH